MKLLKNHIGSTFYYFGEAIILTENLDKKTLTKIYEVAPTLFENKTKKTK